MSAPPAANASCFSAFGLGNGNGCTSNLTTFAIGIGDGAVADAANALFGGAIAIGNNTNVVTSLSAFTLGAALGDNAIASTLSSFFGWNIQIGPGTASTLGGVLNLVLGISPAGSTPNTTAAIGLGNIVAQIGPGEATALGGFNLVIGMASRNPGHLSSAATGIGNLAFQYGPGSASSIGGFNSAISLAPNGTGQQSTTAGLLGSVALNLFGNTGSVLSQSYFGWAVNILGASDVFTRGLLSAALNYLGDGNIVSTTGGAQLAPLSFAMNLFGMGNTVTANNGPLSFVASVFQTAATLIQNGPGIQIGTPFVPWTELDNGTNTSTTNSVSAANVNGGVRKASRTATTHPSPGVTDTDETGTDETGQATADPETIRVPAAVADTVRSAAAGGARNGTRQSTSADPTTTDAGPRPAASASSRHRAGPGAPSFSAKKAADAGTSGLGGKHRKR
ncbi:hypothetical protein B1R94_07770 [Mycolicibacterium litorale]|nr:hypothetical protein B1R94_07770 [Mycolicibacterium litorale]